MDGISRKAARAICPDHSYSIAVLLIRAQRIAMSSQASPELTARAISFSPTDCGCSHASLPISSRRATSPPGYASRTPSVIITTTSPVCIVIRSERDSTSGRTPTGSVSAPMVRTSPSRTI